MNNDMATCTDKNIKEVREKWQRDLLSSIMTEIELKLDGPLSINVDKSAKSQYLHSLRNFNTYNFRPKMNLIFLER